MKKVVVFFGLLYLLSGCVIRGPKVKIEPPAVEVVPPIEVEGTGKSKHCPPGQAKKGRC